mmetsp:Transcript_23812/g.51461  ORF Transcript_23812/g.51461 Transcript_23812/m.51461 type:complete len:82 (+) Transcript_23812:206-451(+)
MIPTACHQQQFNTIIQQFDIVAVFTAKRIGAPIHDGKFNLNCIACGIRWLLWLLVGSSNATNHISLKELQLIESERITRHR